MNNILPPIQKLIYQYLNRDALHVGLKDIFPITNSSEPFSMDHVIFNDNINLVECTRFKSDACEMCYARNMHGARPLHAWVRCYHHLYNLDYFSIINGEIFYDFNLNDKLKKLSSLFEKQNVIEKCLYSQLFDYMDNTIVDIQKND